MSQDVARPVQTIYASGNNRQMVLANPCRGVRNGKVARHPKERRGGMRSWMGTFLSIDRHRETLTVNSGRDRRHHS